ncbi:MAG: NAD(P)/FAD-dependent oxidoreductase [Chloroflexi bacterium]|mgnify:CR=1 FL=1|nr:NAD(P)/FAD-dependent oxidoreductase [Chloroflexota bacterium]
MHELIIIGGGPAGLAAAAYAVRKRMDALFISPGLGGRTRRRLLLPWVDDYQVIVGEETIQRFRSQLDYLEFMRVRTPATGIEPIDGGYRIAVGDGHTYDTRTLIIATGSRGERLNVPGEDELEMRGLCYSAMTYAPLMVDRSVVVVGSELLALRAVAELSRIAREVRLLAEYDGDLDTDFGQAILDVPNVIVRRGCRVLAVKGRSYAETVVVECSGAQEEIAMDSIFVEKQLIPNTALVADLVELDPCGFIRVDARNRTNRPGLFAAGDCTDASAFQVLMGLGDGEKAALSAFDYVLGLPVDVTPCEE